VAPFGDRVSARLAKGVLMLRIDPLEEIHLDVADWGTSLVPVRLSDDQGFRFERERRRFAARVGPGECAPLRRSVRMRGDENALSSGRGPL